MAEAELRGWGDRVDYARDQDGGFFYRPRQVIARDAPGETVFHHLSNMHIGAVTRLLTTTSKNHLFQLAEGVSVLKVVADLKDDGFQAEPNYVLFAHGLSGNPLYGNPLYGNPLYGNPLYGNPLSGNPLYGNPLYGNPLYGNPLYGNPLYGNPLYGNPLGYGFKLTGQQMNSAQPVGDPNPTGVWGKRRRGAPAVLILDSGLAPSGAAAAIDQLPQLLEPSLPNIGIKHCGWGALTAIPPGYAPNPGDDLPDISPGDNALDPIAGHGTFIAGVIELLAPGRKMEVVKVFEIEGDVDAAKVAWCLDKLVLQGKVVKDKTLINLSFGGYAPEEMFSLGAAIRNVQDKGAVVVASAGNDGTWRRSYPACLPGVIGVGALGPFGPALFTNYGPWVRACAPGTEIVSSFFKNWDGPLPGPSTNVDPDRFAGWARWSGTSFAAPVVVAALAREMTRTNCTANQAVERVIDAPGLLRISGLGTVINIAP